MWQKVYLSNVKIQIRGYIKVFYESIYKQCFSLILFDDSWNSKTLDFDEHK